MAEVKSLEHGAAAADTNADDHVCRVCHGGDDEDMPLLCPCKCKGSIKFVHQQCLTTWLDQQGKNTCELCGHKFKFEPIYRPDAPKQPLLSDVFSWCLEKLQMWLPSVCHFLKGLVFWVGFCYYTMMIVRMGGLSWKILMQFTYPHRKDPLPRFAATPLSLSSFFTDALLGFMVLCAQAIVMTIAGVIIDYMQLRDTVDDEEEPVAVAEDFVADPGMDPLDLIEHEVLLALARREGRNRADDADDVQDGDDVVVEQADDPSAEAAEEVLAGPDPVAQVQPADPADPVQPADPAQPEEDEKGGSGWNGDQDELEFMFRSGHVGDTARTTATVSTQTPPWGRLTHGASPSHSGPSPRLSTEFWQLDIVPGQGRDTLSRLAGILEEEKAAVATREEEKAAVASREEEKAAAATEEKRLEEKYLPNPTSSGLAFELIAPANANADAHNEPNANANAIGGNGDAPARNVARGAEEDFTLQWVPSVHDMGEFAVSMAVLVLATTALPAIASSLLCPSYDLSLHAITLPYVIGNSWSPTPHKVDIRTMNFGVQPELEPLVCFAPTTAFLSNSSIAACPTEVPMGLPPLEGRGWLFSHNRTRVLFAPWFEVVVPLAMRDRMIDLHTGLWLEFWWVSAVGLFIVATVWVALMLCGLLPCPSRIRRAAVLRAWFLAKLLFLVSLQVILPFLTGLAIMSLNGSVVRVGNPHSTTSSKSPMRWAPLTLSWARFFASPVAHVSGVFVLGYEFRESIFGWISLLRETVRRDVLSLVIRYPDEPVLQEFLRMPWSSILRHVGVGLGVWAVFVVLFTQVPLKLMLAVWPSMAPLRAAALHDIIMLYVSPLFLFSEEWRAGQLYIWSAFFRTATDMLSLSSFLLIDEPVPVPPIAPVDNAAQVALGAQDDNEQLPPAAADAHQPGAHAAGPADDPPVVSRLALRLFFLVILCCAACLVWQCGVWMASLALGRFALGLQLDVYNMFVGSWILYGLLKGFQGICVNFNRTGMVGATVTVLRYAGKAAATAGMLCLCLALSLATGIVVNSMLLAHRPDVTVTFAAGWPHKWGTGVIFLQAFRNLVRLLPENNVWRRQFRLAENDAFQRLQFSGLLLHVFLPIGACLVSFMYIRWVVLDSVVQLLLSYSTPSLGRWSCEVAVAAYEWLPLDSYLMVPFTWSTPSSLLTFPRYSPHEIYPCGDVPLAVQHRVVTNALGSLLPALLIWGGLAIGVVVALLDAWEGLKTTMFEEKYVIGKKLSNYAAHSAEPARAPEPPAPAEDSADREECAEAPSESTPDTQSADPMMNASSTKISTEEFPNAEVKVSSPCDSSVTEPVTVSVGPRVSKHSAAGLGLPPPLPSDALLLHDVEDAPPRQWPKIAVAPPGQDARASAGAWDARENDVSGVENSENVLGHSDSGVRPWPPDYFLLLDAPGGQMDDSSSESSSPLSPLPDTPEPRW